MAMGAKLKKTTVLAGDAFGFIGNRMLEPYGRECPAMLRHPGIGGKPCGSILDGRRVLDKWNARRRYHVDAGPADVDRVLKGFGMAMG